MSSRIRWLFSWMGPALGSVILQLLVAQFVAWIAAKTVTGWKEAWTMLDLLSPFSLPPSFWIVFWQCMVPLTGLIAVYHGFIAPVIRARRQQAAAYKQEVCDAYEKVAGTNNPGIFNPAHPGNPHAIKKAAQDAVDLLRPKLVLKHTEEEIPPVIDVENAESVRAWHDFLRQERARVHE